MASALLISFEVVLLAIYTAYLVRGYQSPKGKWDVTIATYISWLLGFAGTVLLPYDMSIALIDHTYSHTLVDVWKAIYWSTFMLAWGTLPVQMAFHMSGAFSFWGKLYAAIRYNFISYMAGLVGLLIFIIYLAAENKSQDQIFLFLMAMANTYGVLLIVVLMGYGLVAIPRRLWHMGSSEAELTRLYMLAPSVESSFHDARFELEDCESEGNHCYNVLQASTDSQLKGYAKVIKDRIDGFQFHMRSSTLKFTGNKKQSKTLSDIDKSYLVDLHGRLILAQRQAEAAERRWKSIIYQAKYTDDLIKGTVTPELVHWCSMPTDTEFEQGGRRRESSACTCFYASYDRLRYYWRITLYNVCVRILAIICALASGLILWSEVANGSNIRSPIGTIIVGFASAGSGVFIVQAVAFANLFYMSLCTFYGMFKINLGWTYALHPHKQSSDSALLFMSAYISRLQFSLGYNFLLFLNVPKMNDTSFQNFITSMDTIPLFGTGVSVYAPIITFIVGVLTLFNVYARMLKFLGLEHEDSVTAHDCFHKHGTKEAELREEGAKLIASQLKTLASQFVSSSPVNDSTRDNVALLAASSILTMNDPEEGSSGKSDYSSANRFGGGSDKRTSVFNKVPSHDDLGVEVVPMARKDTTKSSFTSSSATKSASSKYPDTSSNKSTSVSSKPKDWGVDDSDGWANPMQESKTSSSNKKSNSSNKSNSNNNDDPWGGGTDGWSSATSNTFGGRYA